MARYVLFLALAATIVPSGAHAEWMRIGSSTSGSVWYLDPARVKSVGGKPQAWIQVDSSKDKSVSWRRALQLISFDCDSQKYRLLSYVDYDSYGKVIASNNFTDYGYGIGYEPIIPETMVEDVARLVCPSPATQSPS